MYPYQFSYNCWLCHNVAFPWLTAIRLMSRVDFNILTEYKMAWRIKYLQARVKLNYRHNLSWLYRLFHLDWYWTHSTSSEICTQFVICCITLRFGKSRFAQVYQVYFTESMMWLPHCKWSIAEKYGQDIHIIPMKHDTITTIKTAQRSVCASYGTYFMFHDKFLHFLLTKKTLNINIFCVGWHTTQEILFH